MTQLRDKVDKLEKLKRSCLRLESEFGSDWQQRVLALTSALADQDSLRVQLQMQIEQLGVQLLASEEEKSLLVVVCIMSFFCGLACMHR